MKSTTRLPITGTYIAPKDRKALHNSVRAEAGDKCIRCGHVHEVETGYVLTVHHFDGNKANNEWWNLMALCQRCHLQVQGRVNPHLPYFLEHSAWAKPYIAGFYAQKYLRKKLSREEVMAQLDDLLSLERIA